MRVFEVDDFFCQSSVNVAGLVPDFLLVPSWFVELVVTDVFSITEDFAASLGMLERQNMYGAQRSKVSKG